MKYHRFAKIVPGNEDECVVVRYELVANDKSEKKIECRFIGGEWVVPDVGFYVPHPKDLWRLKYPVESETCKQMNPEVYAKNKMLKITDRAFKCFVENNMGQFETLAYIQGAEMKLTIEFTGNYSESM